MFFTRFVPDCIAHRCRCLDENGRSLPDACCRYGADVDLHERDVILAKARLVEEVLKQPFRDRRRWFDESSPQEDQESPSGVLVRTATVSSGSASGCIFLQHRQRGCALHLAAVASGFDSREIKPAVCRLFPLAFGEGTIGMSDDALLYSCASATSAPTAQSAYRMMRATVADVFGSDVVDLLDRVEHGLLAMTAKECPVTPTELPY
ncbi:MAG: hypothetical protein V2A73_02075 [Pseudomonadota bacterium]